MTNTKMIILCGGRGKRMGSFTTNIPKPMIKIGGKPIIEHNSDRCVLHSKRHLCCSMRGKEPIIINTHLLIARDHNYA